MNYYPHHIGDFNNATRHLTRVERALYRELIELYYDIERPLPADDFGWICKKVLANGQAETDAVKAILREFFELEGDLYRHKRCDREIASYRAKQEAAIKAGRASAESRSNAKATNVQRPLNDRATNQEPRTKNQEPKNKDIVGQKPDASARRINGFAQPAKEILAFLNEKTGRNYEPVPANLELIAARLKDGVSAEDLRAVVAKKCREWLGDERMTQYLRPATLFNRTKFAQYQGELTPKADS